MEIILRNKKDIFNIKGTEIRVYDVYFVSYKIDISDRVVGKQIYIEKNDGTTLTYPTSKYRIHFIFDKIARKVYKV